MQMVCSCHYKSCWKGHIWLQNFCWVAMFARPTVIPSVLIANDTFDTVQNYCQIQTRLNISEYTYKLFSKRIDHLVQYFFGASFYRVNTFRLPLVNRLNPCFPITSKTGVTFAHGHDRSCRATGQCQISNLSGDLYSKRNPKDDLL